MTVNLIKVEEHLLAESVTACLPIAFYYPSAQGFRSIKGAGLQAYPAGFSVAGFQQGQLTESTWVV